MKNYSVDETSQNGHIVIKSTKYYVFMNIRLVPMYSAIQAHPVPPILTTSESISTTKLRAVRAENEHGPKVDVPKG